jgi:hypothetical protein
MIQFSAQSWAPLFNASLCESVSAALFEPAKLSRPNVASKAKSIDRIDRQAFMFEWWAAKATIALVTLFVATLFFGRRLS